MPFYLMQDLVSQHVNYMVNLEHTVSIVRRTRSSQSVDGGDHHDLTITLVNGDVTLSYLQKEAAQKAYKDLARHLSLANGGGSPSFGF